MPRADLMDQSAGRRRGVVLATWALALVLIATFMFLGLKGNISFVLELRFMQLMALLQVAIAIAVSTVIFQTVTGNRLLSPSIMGFDALYLLCQTVLVFSLGGFAFAALPTELKFGGEVALMVVLSLLLFLPLLRRGTDMILIMLAGFVLGFLFRSLSSLLSRLIDPNEFAVLQGVSFASFHSFDARLIVVGMLVTAAGCVVAWRTRHALDVIALGRDAAIGLGLDWNRWTTGLLMLVVCLVATATALVGPLAFLGLLVVALAERICETREHAILLPLSAGVATCVLVGAQAMSRFGFDGSVLVNVVVEFVGGIVFITMLLLERRR